MVRPIVYRCTALLALVPALGTSASAQEQAPAPLPADLAKPTPTETMAAAPTLTPAPGECVPERLGPPHAVWAGLSYQRWRISDAPLGFPLVTTGDTGVLGDPTTTVLFGGNGIDYGNFNGLRLDAGFWCNDTHTFGLGGSYASFERRSLNFAVDSTTGPALIGLPFFNVNAGPAQDVFLVANPDDQVAGSLNIRSDVRFDSFELHVRRNLVAEEGLVLDATLGYRYFHLRERLDIVQNSNFTGDPALTPLIVSRQTQTDPFPLFEDVPVTTLAVRDSFHTRNRIHGVQLGGRAEVSRGIFYASAAAKVTLGVNQQRVNINGTTEGTTALGEVVRVTGGRFAVTGTAPQDAAVFELVPAGNLGKHRYNQFIIMPELSLQAGVQLASSVRVYVGYDLLYINDVVRPGTQLDPNVNLRLVPSSDVFGEAGNGLVPIVTRARHDFFAHGVCAGIEVQF